MYSLILDTLGWYGRSVADLELLADAFALRDDGDEPGEMVDEDLRGPNLRC